MIQQGRCYVEARGGNCLLVIWPVILHVTRSHKTTKDVVTRRVFESPQRGPGAVPLVRGTKPPEAESILVIGCPTEPANLAPLVKLASRAGHF